MAIRYQNPFKNVREPEQLEQWVNTARDADASYTERYDAIRKLRGAVQIQRFKGHRVAVAYMKQVIEECTLAIRQGEQNAEK